MGFSSKIKEMGKEHGFFHVLFVVQASWMATLDITKKGFWVRTTLVLLMSPVFYHMGYGEIGEALKTVGSTPHEHPLANLFGLMILYLHWMGWLFPYLLAINVVLIFATRMWSDQFWEEVESVRQV